MQKLVIVETLTHTHTHTHTLIVLNNQKENKLNIVNIKS